MQKPFLIVERKNIYGEIERTGIGPFATDAELIRFAQGIRYVTGSMDSIIGRSKYPENVWITDPNDLFPWKMEHIDRVPIVPQYEECPICDHWHQVGFTGDCRDDANRYPMPNSD